MATIWTQADIDTLKKAVASGVMTVSYSGPPARLQTYHSLAEMRSLLADMQRQVNGGTTTRLVKTSKGF